MSQQTSKSGPEIAVPPLPAEMAKAADEGENPPKNGVEGTSKSANGSADINATLHLLSRMWGEIVLLLMQSPVHRHLFLSDLEWFLAPPLALRQCRIFSVGERSIGFALWASVSEEVEKELVAGRAKLRPDEWNCGDRLWLIEVVAPSLMREPNRLEQLVTQLCKDAFAGRRCKARWVNPKTGRTDVIELSVRETEAQKSDSQEPAHQEASPL